MPNIYGSGMLLPESHGAVRGGLAVALHDPAEVDGLIALCALAPRPPEDPMVSVYRALHEPSMNLAAWAAHWRDLASFRTPGTAPQMTPPVTDGGTLKTDRDDEPLPQGTIGKLRVALDVARELWSAQGKDTSQLALLLLLADPSRPGEGDLTLEGDGAALVIRPGSLLGEVVRFPLSIVSFGVCLVVGGGTTTSARRPEMIGRLRSDALQAGKPPLGNIRELVLSPPKVKSTTRPLAVLIHGLFATDVGTFGALQSRLEKHFEVVGFPHDTLSESIDANARDLVQHVLKLGKPQVSFIAHSRGGLVARRAAVLLANDNRSGNKGVPNCATFGTPHLGAEMAENPGTLIATIAFLKAAVADGSVASVVDMLCCFAEMGKFPGIQDLRPASTSDSSLAELQELEGLYPDARMELFTVGGETLPAGRLQRLAGFCARRILGNKPSDLVVARSSSLPMLSQEHSQGHVVNCNHFGYFQEAQGKILDRAVSFLLNR